MKFVEELESLRDEALSALEECEDRETFEELQSSYLGPDGHLREFSQKIGQLPEEKRPEAGQTLNQIKQELDRAFSDRADDLEDLSEDDIGPDMDITRPGTPSPQGRTHPIYDTLDEICDIFGRLGFTIARGPEVETEFYNFEALHIPLDHPAREAFDNYYLEGGEKLLRSHTSPMQIRLMEDTTPPVRYVVPGKVYRPDEIDASHHQMFHQVEGLMVEKDVSMGDLKGMLELFCRSIFSDDIDMRFRPSYFPFTEPSAETDISCFQCGGDGCSVCGGEGWIEVLGCGMVHPHVFESVSYDPETYTGFAFGLGVERIAMLRRGIEDIRLFTENNLDFLNQF